MDTMTDKVELRSLLDERMADPLDSATGEIDAFIDARTSAHDALMLRAVRDSLDDMDALIYGKCYDCGRAIPLKRLHAIPWAKMCAACQEKQERG